MRWPAEGPRESAVKLESYFDPALAATTVKLLPGEYYATGEELAITTLLGSCVSVCLFDPLLCVGGMNHFMLPEAAGRGGKECAGASSARYGNWAMYKLLESLDKLGASRSRLVAKLFGAGRVMGGADIGAQNASFALDYLGELGITVVASDLGDCCPRRVVFFPASGRAWVKRVRSTLTGGETWPSRC